MLDNREIRIQKPIHTILRTALLAFLQLPASNRARYAFLPADIRQIMNRYHLISKGFLQKEQTQLGWPQCFHPAHSVRGM